MAFDIFTKEELSVAYTITKWALYILILTGVVTGLFRIGVVYATEGQAGLLDFIQQKSGGETSSDTQATQETLKATLETEKATTPPAAPVQNELPLYISVPSLGIATTIESPETTSVTVLDNALSRGPVYYRGSGTPGNRNMFIFGHSTGFSIVNNKAYKVFNNIKNAKVGDPIYIQTSSGTHTYTVQNVKKVSKYSTWVQFNSEKPLLTLSTCDSFGKASDRYVLEATYVGFKGK
jgi:LPXTG-site transpeptidase (sortase) family protein